MVSARACGLSVSGSSTGLGNCVMFLDRHLTLTVPLSTQANLMLGVTLRWTSILSKVEEKYSKSLHATETVMTYGLMRHLVHMQT